MIATSSKDGAIARPETEHEDIRTGKHLSRTEPEPGRFEGEVYARLFAAMRKDASGLAKRKRGGRSRDGPSNENATALGQETLRSSQKCSVGSGIAAAAT